MKFEVTNERDNRPLSCKEISFRIDHQGATTPSRADVLARIVAEFDADVSRVVVRSLMTNFGSGITEGTARIYDSAEQLRKIELPYILKRHESKKKEAA